MLRQFTLAVLLSGPAFAQTHTPPVASSVQLDEIRAIKCVGPEGFRCGILVDLYLPAYGDMIASVVGGEIHQISVIIGESMYTVVYDPPLKRDEKFSGLRRYSRVPARIDGHDLTIQWPDKTKSKGRIVGREKIRPELAQPA
jgi:hypothetical protein